jgi:hypothetical protein
MHIFFSKTRHIKLNSQSLIFILILVGLMAACAPTATPVPTPLPTLVASLTATSAPEISAAVNATLTALAPIGATPTDITLTPTDTPEATPEATDDSIVVTLPALAGQKIPPPLTITLPENWKTVLTDVQVLPDVDNEIRGFPIEVHVGPVTGGTGTIVLYWGFPNINLASSEVVAADAQGMAVAPDVWSDGLRLLNLAVVEQGCTVGTDLRRTYRVGLLPGVGTQFSAVNCPELPPTRGWFVALQEKGLNFVFYVYVEGEGVMDNQNLDAFRAASDELQAILDTVRFNVPDIALTLTPSP